MQHRRALLQGNIVSEKNKFVNCFDLKLAIKPVLAFIVNIYFLQILLFWVIKDESYAGLQIIYEIIRYLHSTVTIVTKMCFYKSRIYATYEFQQSK